MTRVGGKVQEIGLGRAMLRVSDGRLVGLILGALALLAGCTLGPPRGPAADVLPKDPPKDEAISSFRFDDLQGEELAWDAGSGVLEARGDSVRPKVLILHVFQPDCPKCQELARALDSTIAGNSGSAVAVGIAYRGDRETAARFVRETGVSYPMAVGTGTEWARRWGRGDPLYIVSSSSEVQYQQTGFRAEDVALWRRVIEDLAAGRSPSVTGPERKELQAGDPLPAIRLQELMTGRPLSLAIEGGRLAFKAGDAKPQPVRASLGFFSRY